MLSRSKFAKEIVMEVRPYHFMQSIRAIDVVSIRGRIFVSHRLTPSFVVVVVVVVDDECDVRQFGIQPSSHAFIIEVFSNLVFFSRRVWMFLVFFTFTSGDWFALNALESRQYPAVLELE
jgi:hypothetical protein